MKKLILSLVLGLLTIPAFAQQQSASKTFTMTVTPAPVQPLVITTTAVPDGQATVQYSFTFSATGGVAPYTWSGATLPAGLSVSSTGILSGTPTTQGSYTFTVTVKDSEGAAAKVGVRVK